MSLNSGPSVSSDALWDTPNLGKLPLLASSLNSPQTLCPRPHHLYIIRDQKPMLRPQHRTRPRSTIHLLMLGQGQGLWVRRLFRFPADGIWFLARIYSKVPSHRMHFSHLLVLLGAEEKGFLHLWRPTTDPSQSMVPRRYLRPVPTL